MTLIIRVFQPNIKAKLLEIERKLSTCDDAESKNTFTSTLHDITCDNEDNESLRSSLRRIETSTSKENRKSTITNNSVDQFDEHGNVIPYIDLESEFKTLMDNQSSKSILKEFEDEFDKLESLIIEEIITN